MAESCRFSRRVLARKTTTVKTATNPPPWPTPANALHSAHRSGANSRPSGRVDHSTPLTRNAVSGPPNRLMITGVPNAPISAQTWKIDDAAPACPRVMPCSSASRVGNQAVSP